MLRRSLGFLLAVAATSSAGPIIGRSFPDANCAYSLPVQDWEWLDPNQAPRPSEHAIAHARDKSGVSFWLIVETVTAGQGVGPASYENLEKQLLERHNNWTKVSSKHVMFKGVPAFEINFRQKGNKSAGRFLFLFADNRAYLLAVETPAAELGPEADAIFDRFTFLNPPHAMMQPHEDKPETVADKIDQMKEWFNESSTTWLGGFGLVMLVLFGAWTVIRMRG
jgi:hypothetical protein